ncbi:MAG: beta-lactamase family protein [Acidimicrobiia bacterium]|nr:beta-lactamase family protein [Acidimicrobiia bacterium]
MEETHAVSHPVTEALGGAPMLRRLLLLATVTVLVAGGCSQTDEAAVEGASTSTTIVTAGGGDFLGVQVDGVTVPDAKGAVMVAIAETDGTIAYASKGSDSAGSPLTPDEVFRIGSITKMFTAALMLLLVDDGLVDVDSLVSEYVTRVRVPDGVTVRNLLEHTSGIPDYTDSPAGPFREPWDDPEHIWTPEETIGLIDGEEPLSEPGAVIGYSNTNYIILGVLIEEVTGLPFEAVLRSRILDPLELEHTYLAGLEEGPEPFGAYTNVDGSTEPIDFDYTAVATAAWAAGGLVSSVADLHAMLDALFEGSLVSTGSLAAMVDSRIYAFGLVKYANFGEVYGHPGGIPGYTTTVMHAPETGKTAVWVTTNNSINPNSAVKPVAEYITQP